jgi:hypothetical protein
MSTPRLMTNNEVLPVGYLNSEDFLERSLATYAASAFDSQAVLMDGARSWPKQWRKSYS